MQRLAQAMTLATSPLNGLLDGPTPEEGAHVFRP